MEGKTEEFSEKDEQKDRKIGQGKLKKNRGLVWDVRPPNNEIQTEKNVGEEITKDIIQDYVPRTQVCRLKRPANAQNSG